MTVLCDTNIIIEVFKGNLETIKLINKIGLANISISSITAMELLYGALNKRELSKIKKNINSLRIIDFNEEISGTALSLIESYAKSHNLQIPDAIIAATALFYETPLLTYNLKDFKYIKDIDIYSV
ncbi:type II toxin-antitoxin system VapC family toxin [bacterium]|nr:type II toxin-antitoxin system VapC family toxin [bacterium]